jgi:hypothetical protein
VVLLCMTALAHGKSCPTDMVSATKGTCIDKYEWRGLGVDYPSKPLLALSGLPEPYGSPYTDDLEGICRSQGKRACTLREWVAACRGPGGTKYPYGATYDATACNTATGWRAYDEQKVFRRDARELERLDQSVIAGSMPRCVSAAGAFDMIGNAEEWVRCDQGKYGWCLVGGFWAHPQTCNDAIVVHSPYWHFYETSGRCCRDLTFDM